MYQTPGSGRGGGRGRGRGTVNGRQGGRGTLISNSILGDREEVNNNVSCNR